jgi:hypothetical protein
VMDSPWSTGETKPILVPGGRFSRMWSLLRDTPVAKAVFARKGMKGSRRRFALKVEDKFIRLGNSFMNNALGQ